MIRNKSMELVDKLRHVGNSKFLSTEESNHINETINAEIKKVRSEHSKRRNKSLQAQ